MVEGQTIPLPASIAASDDGSAELVRKPAEDMQIAPEFREAALAGMQNPTFEDKRRVFMLRVNVSICEGRAHVACRIPTSESLDRSPGLHTSTSCWKCRSCVRPLEAGA